MGLFFDFVCRHFSCSVMRRLKVGSALVVDHLSVGGFGCRLDGFGGWVESFELDSCVSGGELPVHAS